MSTRAQIAIEVGPGAWAHVYVHYDGYPEHMLPALARWTPDDILAAKEIRQFRADELDCFVPPPRAPDPAAPDLRALPPLRLAGRLLDRPDRHGRMIRKH